MKSYEQGRMDAWERIDAIKRRLGLAGFFNEQKIKRYPKGHPKAGQFMDLPDQPMKVKVPREKKFVVDIDEEKSTEINGYKFSLRIEGLASGKFSAPQLDFPVVFLANGETVMQEDIDPLTGKRAAIWWRRQSIDLTKKLPEGTVLSCLAEDEDGGGAYRSRFYEALGFKSDADGQMYSIVKKGKLNPVSKSEFEEKPKRFLTAKSDLPYVKQGDLGEKLRDKIQKSQSGVDFRKWKITQLADGFRREGRQIDSTIFRLQQKMLQRSRKEIRAIQDKMAVNTLNSKRLRERSKTTKKPPTTVETSTANKIDMLAVEDYFRRRNGE